MTLLKPKATRLDKDQIKLANSEFVASANLTKSTLESEAFKTWISRLSKIYNVPQMAKDVPMSRRTISREMEKISAETSELIKSKAELLSTNGQASLQADHVVLLKATGEEINSFLAIIITLRNSDHEMVPFPLVFEPSKSKTFSAFRNDLRRVLKVIKIFYSKIYNSKLLSDSVLENFERKIAENFRA